MLLQVGVKILIENEAGEMLFLRRAQTMSGETRPHWDIPGGRIDPSESLMQALAREVQEETGMTLVDNPVLLAAQDIFVSEKDFHTVRLTYRGHASGEVKISDEHSEYIWMNVDEALTSELDPYTREVLKNDQP